MFSGVVYFREVKDGTYCFCERSEAPRCREFQGCVEGFIRFTAFPQKGREELLLDEIRRLEKELKRVADGLSQRFGSMTATANTLKSMRFKV